MSDTEEDSTNSESIWPVNEDWLTGIIKQNNHENTEIDVNIRVSRISFVIGGILLQIFVVVSGFLFVFVCVWNHYILIIMRSIVFVCR